MKRGRWIVHTCRTWRIGAAEAFYLSMLLIALCTGCSCTSDSAEQPASLALERPMVDEQTAWFMAAAQQAFDRGDFQVALAFTDSAAHRVPDLADSYFLRGRIYTVLDRPDLAQEAYERVLALDPDFRGAWFNLGNTAFRRQQYRTALHSYRKEQARHPAPAVLLAMGRAYARLGVVDSARQAYQQAIEADPLSPAAHARLSQLYEQTGKLEEALLHARRALELSPEDVNYRYMVGSLLLQTGQAERAAGHLEAVVARVPWHYGAHFNLGQALVRLGRQDEARRYLSRADTVRQLNAEVERLHALAKMNPDQVEPWLDLADALHRMEHFEEAIEAYEAALFLDPANPALHTNLASLFLAAGDTTRAIQQYQAVLQRHPTYSDAWLNLGVAYASSGRMEMARQSWERILEYEPQHEDARSYLARLDETE